VRIVQVTDTHITTDGAQARYLVEALHWIDALQPRPAAVVLSGDAVNTGAPRQYEVLRDLLARSRTPVYVVPGNHDRRGPLRDTLPDRHFPGVRLERLSYVIDDEPVRLIGLDTSEHIRPGGILDDATLDWFDDELRRRPGRPTLVFMHHPPFRTGVNAADLFGFTGLARFRRIIESQPSVIRIVAGHIHCEREAIIGAALATTALSSVPQHVPELFERQIIGFRPEPAGLAVHTWDAGAFSTTSYVNVGGDFVARTP
jgi:3',5'-cyclic AMP phosphodiesterase CpdA